MPNVATLPSLFHSINFQVSVRHNHGKIERSNSEMERIENLIKEIEG